MTQTLHATLMFAAVPIAPGEGPRIVSDYFGRVVSAIVSVATDYLSETIFCGDVAHDMMYKTHIGSVRPRVLVAQVLPLGASYLLPA